MNVGASEYERSCSWYSDMIRANVNAVIGIEKLHRYRFYAVIARMKRLLICRFYAVVARMRDLRKYRFYVVVAKVKESREYRW